VKDENYAIDNFYLYGPTFGSNDLQIFDIDNANYYNKGSYEKHIRDTEEIFFIEEYEIFQINV
jgi:hypothetical protein